ncbi:flagellar motor protein MotD [Undibacterium sp. RTI2.1]|uniref:flagellar motor protein MotD n=1 Tax=unclassified Undibacterium TaxID=2630295 RepID=UPI002AB359F7|nr:MULTISPECIES: flagellar motor protein MotD [unclassified Undibacterium]MDY7537994.1 flagellar motor protein MotD [Undibacterium sp. 5I1]MEB0032027.1 flagellar motor protein MotD [Undibacterium sp. RTI2.1]MEB0117223.1 flagellar motor protein MotD [Undibacterium sp. RTI2.2]MEB0231084.1 flagellar motor protein MotD [Undibacterium sp. 10I3]MEB0257517.1 flagellar motor protein MotD [Undibacterium sp. 5I1]
MKRKKYQEEHDNHDRWLVSYADFITLLFAFFVVMYAISSVNEGKYRVLSNSLTGAFGKAVLVQSVKRDIDVEPTIKLDPLPIIRPKNAEPLRKEREQMTGIARDILAVLEPLVREGKVRVTQTSRGVTIEINASVLFAPGEAKLNDDSNQALTAIASVLKLDSHAIQVEGYTDNLPIKNTNFPSNWELSAVRASTVVRLFTENGVDENRMTAVGQGPKMPVGSNDTIDGRARNRRVTVTILAILPESGIDVPVTSADKRTN